MKLGKLFSFLVALMVFGAGLSFTLGLFVFNILLVLVLTIRTLYYQFGRTKFWAATITTAVLITGGIYVAEFQSELQTYADIVYECGYLRIADVAMAFFSTVIATPGHFLLVRWNDIIIYLRNCISQFIDDILLIGNIFSLEGITEFIQAIWHEIICVLEVFTHVDSLQVPILTNWIQFLIDEIVCLGDIIVNIINDFITLNMFETSCYFMDLDHDAKCFFRHMGLGHPPPDVADDGFNCIGIDMNNNGLQCPCTQVEQELLRCVARFLDFVTNGLMEELGYPRFFVDLADALTCVITSIYKPPFWFIVRFIDPECGYSDFLDFVENGLGVWIFNIFHCLDSLLNTITLGEFNNFLNLILDYLLEAIGDVVNTVLAIRDCFQSETFLNCVSAWPQGPCIGDGPCGQCVLNRTEGVVPQGGIFTCFQDNANECLYDNAPLLKTDAFLVFADIMDVLYQVVDGIVCPFSVTVSCFELMPFNGRSYPEYTSHLNTHWGVNCTHGWGDACSFSCPFDFADSCTFNVIALNWIPDTVYQILNALQTVVCDIYDFALCTKDVFATCSSCDSCNAITALNVWFTGYDGSGCFAANRVLCCPGGIGCDQSFKRSVGTRDDRYKLVENLSSASKRSADPNNSTEVLMEWQYQLQDIGVDDTSFCGALLHSKGVYEFDFTEETNSVESRTYFACLANIRSQQNLNADKNYSFSERVHTGSPDSYNTAMLDQALQIQKWVQKDGGFTQVVQQTQVKVTQMVNALSTVKRTILMGEDWNANTYLKPFIQSKWFGIMAQYWERLKNHTAEKKVARNAIAKRSTSLMEQDWEDNQVEVYYQKKLFNDFADFRFSLSSYWEELKYNRSGGRSVMKYSKQSSKVNNLTRRGMPLNDDWAHPDNRPIAMQLYQQQKIRRDQLLSNMTKLKGSWDRIMKQAPKAAKIFDKLNDRFDIYHNQYFQAFHGALTTLRERNFEDVGQWWMGNKKYLVESGFVETEKYERVMSKRSLTTWQFEGSLLDVVMGSYNARTSPTTNKQWINVQWPSKFRMNSTKVGEHMDNLFKRNELSRMSSRLAKNNHFQSHSPTSSSIDSNAVLRSLLDVVSSVYAVSGVDGVFTVVWDALRNFFSESGIGSTVTSLWDETTEFLARWISAPIPESIDGTDMYSPFALPLYDEQFFSSIQPLPYSFVMQIQWPQELIRTNCTHIYNGNPNLFEFDYSDNCDQRTDCGGDADDQTVCTIIPDADRPFCSACDYCVREYDSCKESGIMVDFVDSLFYLTGVLPIVLEFLIQGGLPVKGLYLVGRNILAIFGTLFSPLLGVSLILVLVLNYLWAAVLWTIGAFFLGIIPLGFIVIAIAIILKTIGGATKIVFPIPIVTILIVCGACQVLLVLLSYFFDIPRLSSLLTINTWLAALFQWIANSPFLNFTTFNIFPFFLSRIQAFEFVDGVVPSVSTFCFFVVFENLGYLLLIIFLITYFHETALGLLSSSGDFVIEVLLLFWALCEFIYFWSTGLMNDDSIEQLEAKVDTLEQQLSSKKEKFSKHVKTVSLRQQDSSYVIGSEIRVDVNDLRSKKK